MDTLPLEIVTRIISLISRSDTIQCALVSRSWRHRIPPCSAIHWHDVSLDEDSCSQWLLSGFRCCFSPCIKSVSLAPGQCFTQFRQSLLLDVVKTLGPQVEKLEIESLAIQSDFLQLFGQALGQTRIQSLTLEYTPNLLDIPCLLACCPTLRQLEYRIDPSSTRLQPAGSVLDVSFSSSNDNSQKSALESLTIHAGGRYTFDLGSVLQDCPGLCRIRLAGFRRTVSCTEITSYCPGLEMLCLGQARQLVPGPWEIGGKGPKGCGRRLCSLVLGKDSSAGADDLGLLLDKYHPTLEALYVTHSKLLPPLSSDLILGQLRTFAYDGDTSSETVAKLIRSSPGLVHIELHNCLITAGLVKALSDVPQLASLALSFDLPGQNSIRLLLEKLSSGCLKRLYYKDQGHSVTASLLEAFAWIPTLENLTLDLAEPCAFDRATAVAWVKGLLGSLANLRSLQLIGFDRISHSFLIAIADHSVGTRLVSLRLQGCSLVTPEALGALVHHKTTTLCEVVVDRCYGLRKMELPRTSGRLRLIIR